MSMSRDIRHAKFENFVEQTKQGLLQVVGSRIDAIRAEATACWQEDRDEDGYPEECPPPAGKLAHHVKCWPRYFAQMWTGQKRAEVRVNDRDYQPGDYLVLREYEPSHQPLASSPDAACTGRWMVCVIVGVSDLDAVVAKNVVLLSLEFGCVGNGGSVREHPLGQPFAANDAAYAALCVSTAEWSHELTKYGFTADKRGKGAYLPTAALGRKVPVTDPWTPAAIEANEDEEAAFVKQQAAQDEQHGRWT